MTEYSVVKVVRLHTANRQFDGTKGVARAPRIGDVGTIVYLEGSLVIVECVDNDGMTTWLADFDRTELEVLMLGESMDERKDPIVSELEKIAEDAKAAFGSLSLEQLNWKPDAASWSVAQCLDHLIRTNESLTAAVRAKLDGKGSSFFEKYSPFSGFFGSYLKKFMVNDSKKAKAPSNEIVPPSDIDGEIVSRFCDEQAKTIRAIAAAGKFDPDKTILTSPFLRIMTYSLGDTIDILVEHEKRHFRQAQRVMASPGFPGGTKTHV